MSRLLQRLDRHWFAPARLTDLAAARIVLVGTQLGLLLVPLVAETIGACVGCSVGYQRWLAQIDSSQFLPIPALKVLLAPFGWGVRPPPMFLEAVWLAAVVAGITALIGLYTRPSLFVFAAASTLLVAHAYSYREFHHPEAPLIIALWTLAFAPSGSAWSVDHLAARIRSSVHAMRFEPVDPAKRLSPMARWPLRLVQWVMGLVYLSAGIAKLGTGGLDWFNGYTMSYAVARDAIDRGSAIGLWFAGRIRLLQVLSTLAVAWELAFWLAVVLPVLAWPMVLLGAGMHTGIYLLQRAPFPQFIALYIVFLEPLRRYLPARLRLAGRAAPARWTVIYDGLCPLCIRTMVVLDELDLRRRLHYVDLERERPQSAETAPGITPAELRHAMHLVAPDGTVFRGYRAFRQLTRLLPPLWPLVPFTVLPFANKVGSWMYDRVARSRDRRVCRAESCAAGAWEAASEVR